MRWYSFFLCPGLFNWHVFTLPLFEWSNCKPLFFIHPTSLIAFLCYFFSCSCLFWINHLVSFAEKFGSGLAFIFSIYAPKICGLERHFIFGIAPGRNKSLIKWTKKTLDETLDRRVFRFMSQARTFSRFLPPRRKIRHVQRWVTKTHKTTSI